MITTLNDVPPDVPGQMSNAVQSHATPIVRYTKDSDGKEVVELKGSGTFITASGQFAILTAAHVVEELKKKRPFSLAVYVQEGEHKHLVGSDMLELKIIAQGEEKAAGPDLGLIMLHEAAIGWIKASRTFYDLDAGAAQIERVNSSSDELYVYAICGAPDLFKADLPSERGYAGVRQYTQLCLFGSVGLPYVAGDYDYCEVEVDYSKGGRLPESFGGVSGGGLWAVPLTEKEGGGIETGHPMLRGVAFYQTEKEGSVRKIRCHGPAGIYGQVREEMIRLAQKP